MANEYMMVSSVTNVLSQATDWLIDLGENWIDTQLDDGLLKEIPIIKALTLGMQSECRDLLRLTSLGLMYEQDSPNFPYGDNDTPKNEETSFNVTDFGRKFAEIVL